MLKKIESPLHTSSDGRDTGRPGTITWFLSWQELQEPSNARLCLIVVLNALVILWVLKILGHRRVMMRSRRICGRIYWSLIYWSFHKTFGPVLATWTILWLVLGGGSSLVIYVYAHLRLSSRKRRWDAVSEFTEECTFRKVSWRSSYTWTQQWKQLMTTELIGSRLSTRR